VVKITAYADRLIEGLKKTAFIEKVKAAQVNWIGRTLGMTIDYPVVGSNELVSCYSTRPDTNFGATFVVVAPEHPVILELTTKENLKSVRAYIQKAQKKSDLERTELGKEKTGVFTGSYCLNRLTGKKMPIWVSDFVVLSAGTGIVVGVPAHDERDWQFAKKYELEIIPVVKPEQGRWDYQKGPFLDIDKALVFNSDFLNGLTALIAKDRIIDYLIKKGWGRRAINYHLRDWIFSRQHYWGEPIPMVFCEKCGEVPVPERNLPVELPKVENYRPTDTGESPLAKVTDWVNTVCPKCGGSAKRETDTMPNWAGSDWYFLRYLDPHNNKALADLKKAQYWLPVDVYVGGDEHNTLHLLYSRFTYQFLWDIGVMPKAHPEPYYRRLSHGVILGSDRQKMSKSRENVINPDEIWGAFGVDALRTYLMFMGPFESTMAWSQESMEGCYRFIKRVWDLMVNKVFDQTTATELKRKLAKTIKKVGEDINKMRFNTAVAAMMEFLNCWQEKGNLSGADAAKFLQILAPFSPYISEELWERLGNKFSIHTSTWPSYDQDLIEEGEVQIVVQVNGKLRDRILMDNTQGRVQKGVEPIAKMSQKTKKHLEGKMVKKIIFIPGKLINFVVK
jgi:leucyl-tRNA synthetase